MQKLGVITSWHAALTSPKASRSSVLCYHEGKIHLVVQSPDRGHEQVFIFKGPLLPICFLQLPARTGLRNLL
ncbi:hypothetical protein Y1Q_0003428 [Alligator mississippiensis]|uniref:Uncharacterized protein n=1 Tax=Alligator mississippiensis TaxID=8496 RepID=A0A151N4V8_ALLMI|nr:hypothetical protein Y1Q_0003428 [Alligator mississippiensis]